MHDRIFSTRVIARALRAAAAILMVLFSLALLSVDGYAQQAVVVTVNDRPITNYDIEQRMRMNEIIGFQSKASGQTARREVLEELIDEVLKVQEAKRLKVNVSPQDVEETLKGMASRAGSSVDAWAAQLKKHRIDLSTLKRRIEANLAWNRLIAARYNINTNIESALVEQRLKAIRSDPARKPRTIYLLQEIRMPIDAMGGAGEEQLLYARFLEAQQVVQRYKGCDSVREATRGVFNVQVRPTVPVPPESLPPQLKEALDKVGVNKILGPSRAKEGIQLIGFCGKQTVAPPEVTREQVENMLLSERVGLYTERYIRELRRTAFIDYKDPAYSQ
ncbi:SurA N-terminal domain-containing protein [Rhodoligotrophos defluvii]|uniref:SurA N-terminal domain-containing protein n=1 Tax=Rhodoligotrophos defluvii TaxID=2561934 RepID=UPI0014859D12|nr:SurA N-terminal domain-containing protein [Rhodoligotrophos defluvii]